MNDFKVIVKNSNFVYLWISQMLSQVTINIMNFLLLIKLFSETGSTIATSLLWVAYALPAILIGPIAAASVDMIDRRKTLIITNLLQSLTIFLYALVHENRLFLLYGVAIGYSFFNQFYVPAEAASLPSLVKKKDYPQANGLFFLTQQTALIIGFGLAGVLKQLIGFEKSLFLCAVFIFIAFLSVTFLPDIKVEDKIPKSFEEAFFKFFERIMEGYKFIKNTKEIFAPFVLLSAFQIGLAIVMINVPLVATEILRVDVNASGTLVIVPAGIGAAIGAAFIPGLLRKNWRKKRVIDLSLMVVTLSLFLLIFIVPELKLIPRLILGIIAIVGTGLSFVGVLIPSQTLMQEKTPGGLRGRVFGNFWFLVTIATIFPVVFSGAVSELFGIRFLFILLAGLSLSALVFSKRIGDKIVENGFDALKP